MSITDHIERIFTPSMDDSDFTGYALAIYRYQYSHNEVYRNYSKLLNRTPDNVDTLERIPFLPIAFFKTHPVKTGEWQPQSVFGSSGTTGMQQSFHEVKDISLYEKSFLEAFRYFYGEPTDYCFLALLPSYLERTGSSLIYMLETLMQKSGHPNNGFYLYEHDKLKERLLLLDKSGQKVFLWGVTYALLDFAEESSLSLHNTIVLETGGMKGRRKEIIRSELHEILKERFGINSIHSEYGMAELLSQAYSKGKGIFETPPWMKIFVREIDDPLTFSKNGVTGGINIIDLANIHSCSFIATQDLGKCYSDGSFEISGRFDASDVRGCNLLVE